MDIEKENLILKVIGGHASEAEVRELEAWLDAHPEHKEEFDMMKMMLSEETSPGESEADPAVLAFARLELQRKRRARVITMRNQAGIFILILSLLAVAIWLFDPVTHTRTPEKEFVFAAASFLEITEILEERMNAEIEIENPAIRECRFTGAFPASATVEDVLAGITYQSGVSFERVDGTYVLQGSGCGGGP
jgi:hypothetical protein